MVPTKARATRTVEAVRRLYSERSGRPNEQRARNAEISAQATKQKSEQIDKALVEIRGGDESRVRTGCLVLVNAFVENRRAEVVPLLEGLLSHSQIPTRRDAALALGTWGTRDTIPKLEALLTDRSGLVRSAASRAIEKIKKRP